jgi:hypothetical protein
VNVSELVALSLEFSTVIVPEVAPSGTVNVSDVEELIA